MIVPSELNAWARDLQATRPDLNMTEVAKKWTSYCRKNPDKCKRGMTREWFEGFVKNEKPAKTDVGTAKKKHASKVKPEPKAKKSAKPTQAEAESDEDRERKKREREAQVERNRKATEEFQRKLDAERVANQERKAREEQERKEREEHNRKAREEETKIKAQRAQELAQQREREHQEWLLSARPALDEAIKGMNGESQNDVMRRLAPVADGPVGVSALFWDVKRLGLIAFDKNGLCYDAADAERRLQEKVAQG